MIKVMLVDDHRIIREGLKMLLETMDDYKIICEAENGEEALERLKKNNPDIILLDLNMPKMDGLSFLARYQQLRMNMAVVVLTTLDDKEKIQTAIQRGARSYLLKDASRETLDRTLKAALQNEMLLTAEVTKKLLSNRNEIEQELIYEDFNLTEREIHTLTLVARGDTNRSIAIEMDISERTVKAHLTSIYEKMEVTSRAEAVGKALANKLISL